jgi:hypothetical protein
MRHISSTETELEQHYQQNLPDYKRENGRNYLYVRFSPNETEGDNLENQLKNMKNKSSALLARAKQIGLTEAAKEAGLKVEESGFFSSTAKEIPRIGASPNLVGFAFANAKGAVPSVYFAPGGDQYVCEVNAEMPEFYLDYESQKVAIGKQLSLKKRIAHMREYAQSFRLQQSRDTFLEAANKDSLIVIDAPGITYDSIIKTVGRIPTLNQAILNTAEGSFTPLIEKENRWLLAMVNKRFPPDMAVWDKDKANIIAAATTKKQQQHLNKWYLEEYNKLEIIDNRKDFYSLVRPPNPQNK